MSIKRFHQRMQSKSKESPFFEALRKLRKMDYAVDSLQHPSVIKWAQW